MKIAIVGSAHPLRGGLAAFNERLAQAFQEAGADVTIYSFSLQYPSFLFPGKTQYSDEPAPEGLDIKVWINSINPFNWWWVGWKIRRTQPDLVICKFWLPFMGPCLGSILHWLKPAKRIAVIDNIIPHEKRPGDRIFAQYFVSATDGFIAMSRSVEAELRQFTLTKPVAYIPHPIYDNYGDSVDRITALSHLGLDPSYRYILFFGFIRSYKGLDLAIEAMADPRLENMRIKLLVAGEYYEDATVYENLIKQKNVHDKLVLRTDFIPTPEVKYFFGAADLVVQPYKSATQSGISQMAYHFEKPMVVTRVGGLPEIVEDGVVGLVVDVEVSAIAGAIVSFYEEGLQERFLQGVKKAKMKYSWDAMVQGIMDMAK